MPESTTELPTDLLPPPYTQFPLPQERTEDLGFTVQIEDCPPVQPPAVVGCGTTIWFSLVIFWSIFAGASIIAGALQKTRR